MAGCNIVALQHNATDWNTLQQTATDCNTLQHTLCVHNMDIGMMPIPTFCDTLSTFGFTCLWQLGVVLQCDMTYVLQCVAGYVHDMDIGMVLPDC